MMNTANGFKGYLKSCTQIRKKTQMDLPFDPWWLRKFGRDILQLHELLLMNNFTSPKTEHWTNLKESLTLVIFLQHRDFISIEKQ